MTVIKPHPYLPFTQEDYDYINSVLFKFCWVDRRKNDLFWKYLK